MWEEAWVSEQAEVKNFHPVSLLPVIDKTSMRALYMCTWSIFSYLEENEILSDKQTGFRPNRSIHVLLRATNDWKKPWILETFVPTVLTDLSKACDSIKHDFLLRKLYDYSINMWCRVGMVHWLSVKEGWYWTMSIWSGPRSAWVLLMDPFLDHYYLCYLW